VGGGGFPHPSRPALGPIQPPVPCLFPGAKEAGIGFDNPPPSRAEVEEIGELSIYFTSGSSLPVFFFGLRTIMLPVFCILMKSVWKSTVAPQVDAKEITRRVSFTWPPLKAALTLLNVKSKQLLGAFIKLRKATLSYVICLLCCLSVCPHGTTQLPIEGFFLNLIFQDFSKICC
jgi:hypothetical protein